jgi:hypothetical protein
MAGVADHLRTKHEALSLKQNKVNYSL